VVAPAPAAGRGEDDASVNQAAQPVSHAFRITELYLRDPHLFAGIRDLTEQPVLNVSVNQILLPNKLGTDADGDGFLDVSILLRTPPFEAISTNSILEMDSVKCTANPRGRCTRDPDSRLHASWPIELRTSGPCLEPLAATTSGYTPAITLPVVPCIVTSTGIDIVFNLGGVEVPVTAARVSATTRLQPSAALVSGLLAGFVTNTAAMRATLPLDAGPLAAGSSLNDYVKQRGRHVSRSDHVGVRAARGAARSRSRHSR
jgi:hypothetical protein